MESSKEGDISGSESIVFQIAVVRSGRGTCVTGPGRVPTRPSWVFDIFTGEPFQVIDDTVVGAANTVSVVVALMSPTSSRVEEDIVALRTRYGPARITDGSSGATPYDDNDSDIRGCQKVVAVDLSATMTVVLPNLTTDIPEGLPVMTTVFPNDFALIEEDPETTGVPKSFTMMTASAL